jgi:hypothetical protein
MRSCSLLSASGGKTEGGDKFAVVTSEKPEPGRYTSISVKASMKSLKLSNWGI